jgi:HlyD family secretion protein
MKKVIIWIIAIVVVIVILGTLFRKRDDSPAQSIPLRTVEAKLGEIKVVLEEVGEIQPIREVDIKSRVSGKVVKFHADEGDYVEPGDLIAEIEPDFNQASQISNIRNNLHLNRIRLENAQKDLGRKQTLFDKDFIPKDDVDKAIDELETANINYESALQQFELIREIDTEGNISRIVSTASGTVIQKTVEEGEMVISSTSSFSDGTVILKLADLRQMVVHSYINEVDIGKVFPLQKADIQADAFPYSKFTGEVSKIGVMAITRNNVKVFPLEIIVLEEDTPLMPGMTANVTIYGEAKSDIVVLPIRTIFSNEDGQDIVYKVVNDSLATTGTLVKTGINDFLSVEIIEGVEEGDVISLVEPLIANQRFPDASFTVK